MGAEPRSQVQWSLCGLDSLEPVYKSSGFLTMHTSEGPPGSSGGPSVPGDRDGWDRIV